MTAAAGRLLLVPNTLDFGVRSAGPAADLRDVLPLGVIRTAARLTHWVAENAKTTRAFLKRVAAVEPLAWPLQSIHIAELPSPGQAASSGADATVAGLLAPARAGHDLGLISEAGLPAVADPGAALVAQAHAAGLVVVALPGPSSLMLALAASGCNGQSFAFVGYLPVDAHARAARIREIEAASRRLDQTQLMIETPYRNRALLAALIVHLRGDTRLSVSCGLTLDAGWTRSAPASQWAVEATEMPGDVPAVFALLAGRSAG